MSHTARYDRAMRPVPRRTALRLIYWNLIGALVLVGFGFIHRLRQAREIDRLIIRVARQHALDPRLVAAVIWKESRFDPDAEGAAGEIGLMQVTEAAAWEWAGSIGRNDFVREELYDPETNLQAGAWYLARALRRYARYGDPAPFALAEFNAGPQNAERWARDAATAEQFIEQITYPGTQRYVRDILAYQASGRASRRWPRPRD